MRSVKLCSALILVTGLLPGQQPDPETTIRSNVHEVLLDVVVRQANHQLDRKLKVSDFVVTEDGVPQTIKAFRFVTGKDTESVQAQHGTTQDVRSASAPPSEQNVEDPAFISIVFEKLGADSRKNARDAALEFLKHELRANTYVAIFSLGNNLTRIQPFSNDRTLLASAVERAAFSNDSSLTKGNSRLENELDYSISAGAGGVTITPTVDPARTPDLATSDASKVIGAPDAILQSQQREAAMYMDGMATVDALLGVLKYESRLPGRKTVLYFCEGLSLPPGQRRRLQDVTSSANRFNVSFYGIDARGLLLSSPNALARNLLLNAAQGPTGKEDEALLEMSVANTQLNLQELSKDTGGFAIMDTNEIGKQMVRVMEDVRTHYEITYSPLSAIYDGRFRKISVTTTNAKLNVQSRDGYYALPDFNGRPLESFEMPALNALSAKVPSVFPLHIAALRFDPQRTSVRYEIAFEMPAENAMHQTRIHATFLGLIKDVHGNVVDKVSRDINQNVPSDKVELFRGGRILFTVPVILAAGHYTLDGVALDADGNRSATRRIAFLVAPPEEIAFSDVELVHDFQLLTAPRDTSDPLQFAGGKVTPQLDSTSPAPDGASLYFVLYPAAGVKPQVTIDFYRDGAAIAQTRPQLAQADEINSIPVVAWAKLPPGNYEARITVEESGRARREWTAFTVGR